MPKRYLGFPPQLETGGFSRSGLSVLFASRSKERMKARMRIVIADDDEVSLDMMCDALDYPDYELIRAANGAEAWKQVSENGVRFVVTDWEMPEMDGIELCRRIRQADFDEHVYIILVSANGTAVDVVRGIAAGADDFIRKPVDSVELNARVRAMHRLKDIHSTRAAERRNADAA